MENVRKQLSLNGVWRLALDPEDAGRAARWFEQDAPSGAMAVDVPAVWDLWIPDYDGVGWYFRSFDLPADWEAPCSRLHFEAADYFAEVWLNGQYLGEHEGGYTPFSFDVTGALAPGGNRVAVRIIDPHAEHGFGPFQPREIPSAKENGYWSFAGLWGDVRLEGLPARHLLDVFVCPDVRRKLLVVQTEASGPGEIHLHVEGTEHRVHGVPGRHVLHFPDFEPWSPESPRLYTLRCDLIQEDGAIDTMRVRFGMREFTVKDNRFHLNNKPCYVKGVLHQPDYARSLAAPESEELARRELELAKEAGFNMVRLHIKTPPRITLDLADEIGLLVYEEPPIGWIRNSAHMRERCEREVREMILRDRNHPSVVIWGLLNETGNAKYVTGGGAQLIKDGLCRLARSLDPSRLIIDDSGGVNATRETARFMRPYHEELEPYDDLHIYQRAPVDRDIELYYQHNGTPDRLCFLSEFGFGGPEDLADTLAQYGPDADRFKDARFIRKMLDAAQSGFAGRGLDGLFGDFVGFLRAARALQVDAARFQLDAIRANTKLAGYCYTQLADAGHEFCAGVLDRWRRPKPVAKVLPALQRPLHPILQLPRTNLVTRESVPVSVILANEERLEGRADLSLQVIGPTKQVLWKKRRGVKLVRHGRELWHGEIAASGSPGTHVFLVRLVQNGRVIAQNQTELHVFNPVKAQKLAAHVLDPLGRWTSRLLPFIDPGPETEPVHIVPPLANTVRGYPDMGLARVLAQVESGAVALFFGPPDDWNDLAEQGEGLPEATSRDAVGCFLPAMHYVKMHPVFDGLPTRCLMRQAYRCVVPAKTFREISDEDICGAFDTTPIASGNYMMGESEWWGTDILVKRFGEGRIVFTHLRLLEHLGDDPVADRLFANLLGHFARRSVPAEKPLTPDVRTLDWLRTERAEGARRWMVLGAFPNWDGAGHETAYPPESEIDFNATYPGWYKAIEWRPWYSRAVDEHVLDLQEAFSPVFQYYPRFDHATGYAYAEFTSDKRQEVTFRMGVQNDMKVWLNGRLVHASRQQVPHDQFGAQVEHGVLLRQSRNTLLVKCSKIPGPFRFSIHFEDDKERPIPLNWWK